MRVSPALERRSSTAMRSLIIFILSFELFCLRD